MQTVGHVSGATYFYGRHQLKNDPFPKDKVDKLSLKKSLSISQKNSLFRI